MAAHQIIAGTLNKGEHMFGVGRVDGIDFIACAVGADLVILASNFERVQVIPAPQSTSDADYRLVTSVSCCNDSGKIAATYGTAIRIFEPTHNILHKSSHNLNYRWFETQMIQAAGTVNSVLWAMDGLRLMVVCQDQLFLYQHRFLTGSSTPSRSSAPDTVCIAEEERSLSGDHPVNEWDEVWRSTLAQPVQFIQFSPDGVYFATCGVEDKIVKVWYADTPVPLMEGGFTEGMQMSFITLIHPAKVTGFEWRKTGIYMPRKCVQNCIISWCEDQTARIWKESTPPEMSVLDLDGWDTSTQSTDGITFMNISDSDPNLFYESKKKKGMMMDKIKRTKNRIMTKLKGLLPENRKKKLSTSASEARELGLQAQTPPFSHFDTTTSPALYVKFHLAAMINAATDCLLVPLMENGSRPQKTFSVHWLNNKELVFSQGAEKLLAEALQGEVSIESPTSDQSNEEKSKVSSNHSTDTTNVSASNTDTAESSSRPVSIQFEAFGDSNHRQNGEDEWKSNVTEGEDCAKQCNTYTESVSSRDDLDAKVEKLLIQWNKNIDILFTLHPVDGSLITWTVEWLDDLHKAPMVSFTSRLPNAFPLTDAASLHSNLVTFNPHDPAYLEALRRNANQGQDNDRLPDKLAEKRNMNMISLLTNHDNGSLNVWQLSMDENSLFSTILSIKHMSRMCGHRFPINHRTSVREKRTKLTSGGTALKGPKPLHTDQWLPSLNGKPKKKYIAQRFVQESEERKAVQPKKEPPRKGGKVCLQRVPKAQPHADRRFVVERRTYETFTSAPLRSVMPRSFEELMGCANKNVQDANIGIEARARERRAIREAEQNAEIAELEERRARRASRSATLRSVISKPIKREKRAASILTEIIGKDWDAAPSSIPPSIPSVPQDSAMNSRSGSSSIEESSCPSDSSPPASSSSPTDGPPIGASAANSRFFEDIVGGDFQKQNGIIGKNPTPMRSTCSRPFRLLSDSTTANLCNIENENHRI